jgi:hypothetical protein
MPKFYVYTLAYPPEMGSAVFYVGKGQRYRPHGHTMSARRGEKGRKADVIRSILANQCGVVAVKVFETDNEVEALSQEKAWIKKLSQTCDLTNVQLSKPEGQVKLTFTLAAHLASKVHCLAKEQGVKPHAILTAMIAEYPEQAA